VEGEALNALGMWNMDRIREVVVKWGNTRWFCGAVMEEMVVWEVFIVIGTFVLAQNHL
jgi:hypothetical protein